MTADEPLIPRPNVRGLRNSDDRDERIADLQYRDAFEFAVGHGVATHAEVGPDGHCHKVTTCWLPSAEVERVAPGEIEGVELAMEALARLETGDQARAALGNLVTKYREWLDRQHAAIPDDPSRREMAEDLLNGARVASNRIEAGIKALDDPQVLDAFRIANKAMARAARRRFGTMQGSDEKSVSAPKWRPFQLAFLLMNLPGIVDPHHDDREAVDLLFFPTGGGKTEAYLGLSAFTLVLRRLRNPGLASAGLSVLMRYTLRLLTLDQLGRASTLICALELERKADPAKLGPWPFEIGLWVGRAATPNRMGDEGELRPAHRPQQDDRLLERRPEALADPAGGVPLVRREVHRPILRAEAEQGSADRPGDQLQEPRTATSAGASRCRSWRWTSRSTGGSPAS